MSKRRSNYQFFQEASLSQKLAASIPLYQKLAGTDREISDSIAVLSLLKEKKMISDDIDFIIELLNYLRMSAFATSESVNEISKMGMHMPKSDSVVDDYEE